MRPRTLMIAVVLIVIVLSAVTEIVKGQEPLRPLPECVQKMSDAEYQAWAVWQNHHASKHRSGIFSDEDEHTYTTRTTINGSSRRQSQGIVSSFSNKYTGRRNSFMSRDGHRRSNNVISTYEKRYDNPHYVPQKSDMVYNPFVKPVGGVGTPDWDSLMVPTSEGVVPMSQVIPTRPVPLEKLYEQLLKGE